jgi:hypothetical protein
VTSPRPAPAPLSDPSVPPSTPLRVFVACEAVRRSCSAAAPPPHRLVGAGGSSGGPPPPPPRGHPLASARSNPVSDDSAARSSRRPGSSRGRLLVFAGGGRRRSIDQSISMTSGTYIFYCATTTRPAGEPQLDPDPPSRLEGPSPSPSSFSRAGRSGSQDVRPRGAASALLAGARPPPPLRSGGAGLREPRTGAVKIMLAKGPAVRHLRKMPPRVAYSRGLASRSLNF